MDGILLGFVTPGPIIITATFIGYWIKGLVGAVVGTVSIFLPPILIIIFLSPYYQWVKGTRWMRPFIYGVLCALVGMLILVVFQNGSRLDVKLAKLGYRGGGSGGLHCLPDKSPLGGDCGSRYIPTNLLSK